jgi:hypothetical protein
MYKRLSDHLRQKHPTHTPSSINHVVRRLGRVYVEHSRLVDHVKRLNMCGMPVPTKALGDLLELKRELLTVGYMRQLSSIGEHRLRELGTTHTALRCVDNIGIVPNTNVVTDLDECKNFAVAVGPDVITSKLDSLFYYHVTPDHSGLTGPITFRVITGKHGTTRSLHTRLQSTAKRFVGSPITLTVAPVVMVPYPGRKLQPSDLPVDIDFAMLATELNNMIVRAQSKMIWKERPFVGRALLSYERRCSPEARRRFDIPVDSPIPDTIIEIVNTSPCVVGCTGCGKTGCGSALALRALQASPTNKVYIVAPRTIVDQWYDDLVRRFTAANLDIVIQQIDTRSTLVNPKARVYLVTYNICNFDRWPAGTRFALSINDEARVVQSSGDEAKSTLDADDDHTMYRVQHRAIIARYADINVFLSATLSVADVAEDWLLTRATHANQVKLGFNIPYQIITLPVDANSTVAQRQITHYIASNTACLSGTIQRALVVGRGVDELTTVMTNLRKMVPRSTQLIKRFETGANDFCKVLPTNDQLLAFKTGFADFTIKTDVEGIDRSAFNTYFTLSVVSMTMCMDQLLQGIGRLPRVGDDDVATVVLPYIDDVVGQRALLHVLATLEFRLGFTDGSSDFIVEHGAPTLSRSSSSSSSASSGDVDLVTVPDDVREEHLIDRELLASYRDNPAIRQSISAARVTVENEHRLTTAQRRADAAKKHDDRKHAQKSDATRKKKKTDDKLCYDTTSPSEAQRFLDDHENVYIALNGSTTLAPATLAFVSRRFAKMMRERLNPKSKGSSAKTPENRLLWVSVNNANTSRYHHLHKTLLLDAVFGIGTQWNGKASDATKLVIIKKWNAVVTAIKGDPIQKYFPPWGKSSNPRKDKPRVFTSAELDTHHTESFSGSPAGIVPPLNANEKSLSNYIKHTKSTTGKYGVKLIQDYFSKNTIITNKHDGSSARTALKFTLDNKREPKVKDGRSLYTTINNTCTKSHIPSYIVACKLFASNAEFMSIHRSGCGSGSYCDRYGDKCNICLRANGKPVVLTKKKKKKLPAMPVANKKQKR